MTDQPKSTGGAPFALTPLQAETERRKDSEAKGEKNAEVFRRFVESVKDYAIFMLDPQGRVATWNQGAQRIKGYEASEIIGSHFSRFYPVEDVRAGKCEMELEGAIRDGSYEDEGWRIRKDGTRFWANVVITAVRDDDGNLIGFSKVTRDLTLRKQAEEAQLARLAAEERFRLLVESVRDYALFMLDPDGRVATWNIGAERIKGYRAEEIIGQHFSVFYPPEDVRAGKCELEIEVATRDGRFEDEGWRVRKDGTRFWANVVLSAVRDASGTLIGFSKITRDLTERRKAEEERNARLVAEHANRAKDEFLAMLGHELRNPLAPIVTALQLMRIRTNDVVTKEQAVIERQVQHMMHLVDDLLDVSRIAAGKVELRKHRIDVRHTIEKAVEIASTLIEQRQHHLTVALPDTALSVCADEARLTQVITNLVTNAAKYTNRGGKIEVVAREEGDEIVIEVRDNGIGITPELLPRVFDLFVQGYQTSERAIGGLGLGLSLVRSLVQVHGGTVTAASAGAGAGSTFTVRLPVASPADKVATPEPLLSSLPAGQGQRILIVDDNEDARVMLAEMLGAIGHQVQTAGDGVAALELLEGFNPDVAILDIGLPVMDGFELATRIRSGRGPEVRLIALTGYGQADDRARAKKAGFDAHLVKPVDFKRLLGTITAA